MCRSAYFTSDHNQAKNLSFLWPKVSGLIQIEQAHVVIARLVLRLRRHLCCGENAPQMRIGHGTLEVLVEPVVECSLALREVEQCLFTVSSDFEFFNKVFPTLCQLVTNVCKFFARFPQTQRRSFDRQLVSTSNNSSECLLPLCDVKLTISTHVY
jgi:hypothetical protein